ncbi:hypothetical protein TI39_contig1051g00023 [Zymoseptoria brevis]|uniref:Uncharacterized protein n=1 Tax=Zymoseptoria brevis TaxID=1047168 RepID=A0A0F4GEJ5_9PEZI|nr:hypothetical protein TI39_contig1051g00023 [Zymoseptoria brevis]
MSNTTAQATCPRDEEEDDANPPDLNTDPEPLDPDQRLPPVPDDHAELTEPLIQQARTLSRDLLSVASGPRTDADLRRASQYTGSTLLLIERSQRETDDMRLREREQEEAERMQREERRRERRLREAREERERGAVERRAVEKRAVGIRREREEREREEREREEREREERERRG